MKQGVGINFVRQDDVRILRDIEQYYSTQIDEMVHLTLKCILICVTSAVCCSP